MHLSGTLDASAAVASRLKQRSIDGNAVQVDAELTKVADTDTQQRLVTSLYGKYMGMFSTALGKN